MNTTKSIESFFTYLSSKTLVKTDVYLKHWVEYQKTTALPKESVTKTLTETELNKLTCPVLKEQCKQLGVSTSGTKATLIARILEAEKANTKKPSMVFVKNSFGNNVHTGSRLVWSESGKCVIGREADSGVVLNLTEPDVEFCRAHNLVFDTNCVEIIHPSTKDEDGPSSESDDESDFSDEDQ